MKLRVAIADDHAVLRAGLQLLINAEPDMEAIGEAKDGEGAIRLAREKHPDVLILDLSMPNLNGLQAIARIKEASPQTRILVLTMHDDPAFLRTALAAGGAGYVLKTAADTELLSAIRTVAGDRFHVPATLRDTVAFIIPRRKAAAPRGNLEALAQLLSEREREVLQLVAEGHTNKEVADRLNLGIKSVETYRARLFAKLELKSRAQLVRFALDYGLIGPGRPANPLQ